MWIVVLNENASSADASGPWWGEAAIAGGFLLVGVLLTFITAAAQERISSKKNLARRFDSEIREAGSLFLIKADANWDAETRHYKFVNDRDSRPTSSKEQDALLASIHNVLATTREEAKAALAPLAFIGSDRLVGSARKHFTNIMALTFADNYNEHRSKYHKSRQDFVDQVRLTIKLPASKIGKKMWFEKLNPKDIRIELGKFMEKYSQSNKASAWLIFTPAIIAFPVGWFIGKFFF